MVIGNGLVAKGFNVYKNNDRFLIFASGVSNSASVKHDAFIREKELLQKALNENQAKAFVYFGTCSVYDDSMNTSPYVLHKLEMENLIQNNHSNYYIFRISNLAGNTNNPNTVLNFFYYHILHGVFFNIWKRAYRNIIDIDDAVLVCSYIIEHQLFKNEITNIANSVNYPVIKIVHLLEEISGKNGNYYLVDKGGNPHIDTAAIQSVLSILNLNFDETYLYRTLKKYYSSK